MSNFKGKVFYFYQKKAQGHPTSQKGIICYYQGANLPVITKL